MSRIHDALRRGRRPAKSPPIGQTAQADAVLAALGYKSDQPRRPNSGVTAGLILFLAIATGVWWLLPPTAPASKPASVPAPAPKQIAVAKPPAASPEPTGREPTVTFEATTPRVEATKPTLTPPQTAAAATPAAVIAKSADAAPKSGLELSKPVVETPARAVTASVHSAVTRSRLPVSPPTPVIASTSTLAETAPPKPDDFRLGLYYQRAGDFEQALVHYKAVLQTDELNVEAHNNVGNLYMTKGLYEDAAREFRRVEAIEPKYVTAHVNLSAALYQLKRFDESASEARTAIRLDPRNEDAFVNLGLAQAAAGQSGEAKASLSRALEIDDHNAAAHYNLALQYEKSGDTALALDHYHAFLQCAGPEHAGYVADVRLRVQSLEHR